jgi:CBS domain-containing protein
VGLLVKDKQTLISVSETTSVSDALALMKTKNITSLPVRFAQGPEAKDGNEIFKGILDIMDIVVYIAYGSFGATDDSEVKDKDKFKGDHLKTVSAGDILGVEREIQTGRWGNGLHVVDTKKDNLYDSLDLFSSGERRVLVDIIYEISNVKASVDEQFKCLSQLDVINYIVSKMEEEVILARIGSQTIEAAGLVNADYNPDAFNNLCLVSKSADALSAFRKMITWRADAVAVTEDGILESKLYANISASDLRYVVQIDADNKVSIHLDNLLLPIDQFLKFARGGDPAPPVTAKVSSTLADVMKLAASKRIHRVWVVDDSGKPVACVRLEDMIKKFSGVDSN